MNKRYCLLELDSQQFYRVFSDPVAFANRLRDAVTEEGGTMAQDKLREEFGINYLCRRGEDDFIQVGKIFQPGERKHD